jgi:hypothetical protein
MTARNPDDVVRLATAQNPMQAHVWEQALKDEGISCKVVGDYLDAGIGNIPGLSAEVWVHRDDLAAAEAVLRRGQETPGEGAPDEAEA